MTVKTCADERKISHDRAKAKYRKTGRGYLQRRYDSIRSRCGNPNHIAHELYKDIELRFTFYEFISCIGKLGIDIHGLEVHRIDPNGHYTLDNIKFVTRKNHSQIHVMLRGIR